MMKMRRGEVCLLLSLALAFQHANGRDEKRLIFQRNGKARAP